MNAFTSLYLNGLHVNGLFIISMAMFKEIEGDFNVSTIMD